MQKLFILLAIFCGFCSIGLLGTSLSTNYWITSQHRRNYTSHNDTLSINCLLGTQNVGIFLWNANLHTCLRWKNKTSNIWNAKDENILSHIPTCIGTAVSCCVSLVFVAIATSMSVYNFARNPYQTMAGPMGVCIYFIIAVIGTLATVLLYGMKYILHFKKNILSTEMQLIYSTMQVSLGVSYWLQIVAIGTISFGVMCIYLSQKDIKLLRDKVNMKYQITTGNVLIY